MDKYLKITFASPSKSTDEKEKKKEKKERQLRRDLRYTQTQKITKQLVVIYVSKYLKKCEHIFQISTNSINQSIDTSNFSDCLRTDTSSFFDCLKTVNITPVFKRDDPLDVLNYRPLCILPLLSKFNERLFMMNYQISLKVY